MKEMFRNFWVALFLAVLTVVGPASALCVQNSFANLRSGPSTDADQTWRVYQYTPFTRLGRYQPVGRPHAWYHVKDVAGKEHWVREDLVSTGFRCVMINNEFAFLRAGPGTTYPKVGAERGDRYLSFRLIEERDGWVKVQDAQGDQMWIHRPLVWIP